MGIGQRPSKDVRALQGLRSVFASAQREGRIGPAAIDSQIDHAIAFDAALGTLSQEAHILDLGSGGGLPGLVVALLRPHNPITLLDGRSERARALTAAVLELEFAGRVSVIGERAEVAGRNEDCRGRFSAVVSRAFGAPAVTAECAAPFLEVGGQLVVAEPPDATRTTARWPEDGCRIVGLSKAEVLAETFRFVRLRQDTPCPDRYPRRVGIPTKRPLF